MNKILINDIYPFELLQNNSLCLLTALTLFFIFAILMLSRWLFKNHQYIKNKEVKDCIKILKENNFYSVKHFAYCVSYYGNIIAKTDIEREIFNKLDENLKIYKYQKNPPEINQKTQYLLEDLIKKVQSHYV